MAIYVDEVMLREPNLLVPGRKPLGPVRIDNSHRLADRLANFFLFRGGREQCLSSTTTLTNNGATQTFGELHSPAYSFDGTDDYFSGGDVMDLGDSNVTFTIAYSTTDTEYTLFCKSRYAAQPNRYFLARYLRDPPGTTATRFTVIGSDAADETIVTFSGSNDNNGKINTISCVWDHSLGKGDLYFNGKFNATATNSNNANDDVTNTYDFLIGRYNSASGSGPHSSFAILNGKVYFFSLHRRKLSAGEIADYHVNPYQVLIPA